MELIFAKEPRDMKERLMSRRQKSAPTSLKQRRPPMSKTLRPQTVSGNRERPRSTLKVMNKNAPGRPRSRAEKNASFSLPVSARTSSGVSVTDSRPFSRGNTTVASFTTGYRSRNGEAGTTTTQASTGRDGARSPTPNALRDMEPAFFDLQIFSPSLTVWRVQRSTLQIVDDIEIGFFHEGNAYLVLQVTARLERHLHYWTGQLCSEQDAMMVEKKARELDRILSTAHVLSREVQHHESVVFLRLFPVGVVYVEGRHKTSIPKSFSYSKRLYHVTGRKFIRAACYMPRTEFLEAENALILDGFPRMYVWLGEKCGYIKRIKTIRIAQKIRNLQRRGKCHIVVIDEKDVTLSNAFRKKINEKVVLLPDMDMPPVSGGAGSTETTRESSAHFVLHRVSGDRVLYDMPEANTRPLHHRYLVNKDSYLLDRGGRDTLYIWVGAHTREDDTSRAISRAKTFSEHHQYATTAPVCRITEGSEPTEFKKCFCDWRDKLSKESGVAKTYTVGNIGRALFSSTDKRTVAIVKECWSDDVIAGENGSTKVWVLEGGALQAWDHVGMLYNHQCYLVLHSLMDGDSPSHVIYYWLGCKSVPADREAIGQLALDKDWELHSTAVLVKVLDGKEPPSFMMALSNWIIIYDQDAEASAAAGDCQMYCIRESGPGSLRIQQVLPAWSSLNSSSSFVIIAPGSAYLWYGKKSGGTERESTKDLLAILCSARMYSYDIVTEGKEPASLSSILGPNSTYASCFDGKVLERRHARLVHCECRDNGVVYTDIDDYLQEDLSAEDIVILDTFDQLSIWRGEKTANCERKRVFEIAETYVAADPAGRDIEDIAIVFVSQRSEPQSFMKHFSPWNALGYSGKRAYEMLRKRLRQENAKIDINQPMVDTGYMGQPKHPYKTLTKKELPSDVDDTHKEYHLSEDQFRDTLWASREQFYRFPIWKQRQLLKSARLLYTPALPRHTIDLSEDNQPVQNLCF